MPEPTTDELNRWAAEKMGWEDVSRDGRMGRSPVHGGMVMIPEFTNDLNAAWMLLETLKIFRCEFILLHTKQGGREYDCGLSIGVESFSATGATPAEGLTRAVCVVENKHKEANDAKS